MSGFTTAGNTDGMTWDDVTGTGTGTVHMGTMTTAIPRFHVDRYFSVPDYVVFAICLGLPLAVGFFFFILSLRKKNSAEEFLMGDRSMNYIVVALSVIASLLNGVFIIGQSSEIHYMGIRVSYQYLGLVIATLTCAHVFVNKYQKMLFTSAYQYVQERYNTPTRVIASLIFCASVVIFLAVVLYVPALAFEQVTGFGIYGTVVITGVICTVYTTLRGFLQPEVMKETGITTGLTKGGLKAVVWTDALQMLILLAGLIAIAIIGAIRVGGGNKVWEVAKATGRDNFRNFHFDPRERTSFWSQSFGAAVVYIGLFISNQMMVQRFMAVPTAKKATLSLYCTALLALPLYVLMAIIGLVLHAYYADCDPLIDKKADGHPRISTADKIFPLFLMDLLGDYRGIPGLIMSSIFAAALSSVSAVINSLAAVCLEDFIDPAYFNITKKKLSPRVRKIIAVIVVIFFGMLTIALSFAAKSFTTKIVQATGVIWGVLGGPLAGIFVMGFLMPFANPWGAISGMISGLVIALWLAIGAVIHAPSPQSLPIGTCLKNPVTNQTIYIVPPTPAPNTAVDDWYALSYCWYGVIGTGVCIIVGMIVSLATCGWRKSYMSTRNPNLMFSVANKCCCCFPKACRDCYNCGVDYDNEDKIELKKMNKITAEKVPNPNHLYDVERDNEGYVDDNTTERNLYPVHDIHNGGQNGVYNNGGQNGVYSNGHNGVYNNGAANHIELTETNGKIPRPTPYFTNED